MPRLVLFALEAPIAALGEVAVGERRYGADRPAKSAVLGLTAAALGIERADEQRQAELHDGLGYAVRVAKVGRLLEDYHTAQVPPARRGKVWATRRAELAERKLETILSQREYRTDSAYTVALWSRGPLAWSPEQLAAALDRPAYTLYLGRKSCPLARPPAAWVVEAATLEDAFAAFDEREQARAGDSAAPPRDGEIFADVEARPWLGPGLREIRIVQRRDALVSRRRWQFGLRQELVAQPHASAETEA